MEINVDCASFNNSFAQNMKFGIWNFCEEVDYINMVDFII